MERWEITEVGVAKGVKTGSVQSQVLNEASVFAVVGVAAQGFYDDFANTSRDLVAGPSRRWLRGQVGAVSHNPVCEVSNGPQFFWELDAASSGNDDTKITGADQRQQHRQKGSSVGVRESYCDFESQGEGNRAQECFQPVGAYELWGSIDGQLGGKLLELEMPLLRWYCVLQGCSGPDVASFKVASVDEEASHNIEGAMSQAGVSCGCGDLAHYEVNELAGSEDFLRFGVFDSDVERIFDSHNDFDGIQSHVWSFGSRGVRRQVEVIQRGGLRG